MRVESHAGVKVTKSKARHYRETGSKSGGSVRKRPHDPVLAGDFRSAWNDAVTFVAGKSADEVTIEELNELTEQLDETKIDELLVMLKSALAPLLTDIVEAVTCRVGGEVVFMIPVSDPRTWVAYARPDDGQPDDTEYTPDEFLEWDCRIAFGRWTVSK